MSKFNWQSRWQETVGKTVTGLSDGAARCAISFSINSGLVNLLLSSAEWQPNVQCKALCCHAKAQCVLSVQIEAELGRQT